MFIISFISDLYDLKNMAETLIIKSTHNVIFIASFILSIHF
jgi:hypothetical protein